MNINEFIYFHLFLKTHDSVYLCVCFCVHFALIGSCQGNIIPSEVGVGGGGVWGSLLVH